MIKINKAKQLQTIRNAIQTLQNKFHQTQLRYPNLWSQCLQVILQYKSVSFVYTYVQDDTQHVSNGKIQSKTAFAILSCYTLFIHFLYR